VLPAAAGDGHLLSPPPPLLLLLGAVAGGDYWWRAVQMHLVVVLQLQGW
jgi:hypothetical protein